MLYRSKTGGAISSISMTQTAFKKHRLLLLDLLVIAVYAVINFLILSRHEPWRDEAQTWLVARDAPIVSILFGQNLYERHPALWYLLLAPLAKSGLPYISQALLHMALAVGAVALFILRSPFSRLTKYLFVFSYYMMSEYAVIARSYILGILLLFALADLYPRKLHHPLVYALLVFLLFNTHFLYFLMAASFALLFVIECIHRKKFGEPKLWLSVALMSLGAAFAFSQGALLPQDHAEYGRILGFDPEAPFFALAKAFIPIDLDVSRPLAEGLGIFATVIIFLSLVKKPAAFCFAGFSLAGLMYILASQFPGHLRHFGLALMALLTALWIGASEPERSWIPWPRLSGGIKNFSTTLCYRYSIIILNVAFLISLKYTFMAHSLDFHHDFSGSKKMARYLQTLRTHVPLDRFVIVANPSDSASAVLPYLPGRKFWYADIQDFGTYLKWNKKRAENLALTDEEVVGRAAKAFGGLSNVLFLTGRPLGITESHGYKFQLLSAVDYKIYGYGYEKFYLYKPLA